MTDEQLDRVVRAADPYRTEVIGRLDGAAQTLLEEIMSSAPAPSRRAMTRRLVTAAAAAAVLVAILGVAAVARRHQPAPPHQALPQAPSTTGAAPAAAGPRTYSAFVLQAAEENPRLLIDEPGWKATTVYGFAEKSGTIGFTKGTHKLEMNWYEAARYDDYYRDRSEVSAREKATVAGRPGSLVTYSEHDWAIMLEPSNGTFVELRTDGDWKRADFDRTVSHIVEADVPTWLDALPAEIVTPAEAGAAADKILADVPLPPGFDKSAVGRFGTNDPYQFGANVTGLVGCGWLDEWERAKKAGDFAAQKRASQAMSSSHKWKVLNDMNAEGDWPEAVWEIGDKMADGADPSHYRQSLGCR
ncbi:hypothetical protein GCM10010172_55440 [Paractinoplanes ferrugineus]|uniref:Uncharacterized protein n=1 Tax=Paractinoplanes ferrugineus TaxID=113564 RepID=A0A919IYW9_9ACTN|nr:hypothetical protein [Actinoplanes ferrugineus]GIE10985.1 hypothetical protein Afe05nite_28250 [Actinoplanes ferrugineus]